MKKNKSHTFDKAKGGSNMLIKEAQVLYDARGKKTHVVLPIKKYEEILEQLEDTEDLKAMNEVEHEPTIPWEEAKRLFKKHSR